MDMRTVDPKLFVTCRLCLLETGAYQIVPAIQEQIKYCFDILVEPFDGLPQLICRKCESNLKSYHTMKTDYIKKQDELKTKVNNPTVTSDVEAHDDTVASLPDPDDAETPETESCVSVPDNTNSETGVVKPKNASNSWKKQFIKKFKCRICDKSYSKRYLILKHTQSHGSLLKKHSRIFKRNCKVSLLRFDDMPNITNSLNKVVYDRHKIIEFVDNKTYYVQYNSKNKIPDSSQDEISTSNILPVDDSSDDEEIIMNRGRKRLRLLSRSSNETVVLGQDESKNSVNVQEELLKTISLTEDSECIHIDDSSNDTVYPDVDNRSGVTNVTSHDLKIIENIISVSKLRLSKKAKASTNHNENLYELLKHKVLSIGRKIINKEGFPCVGLLRYLEHKNLKVHWSPPCDSANKESGIRIQTIKKLNMPSNYTGWKSLQEWSNKSNNIAKVQIQIPSVLVPSEESTDKETYKNKLLNANPVANPKQLHKKNNVVDTKTSNKNPQNLSEVPVVIKIDSNLAQPNEESPLMPIITSTISLAEFGTKHKKNDTMNSDSIENDVSVNKKHNSNGPRIKVKPVSELMPNRTDKNPAMHHITISNVALAPIQTPNVNIGRNEPISVNNAYSIEIGPLTSAAQPTGPKMLWTRVTSGPSAMQTNSACDSMTNEASIYNPRNFIILDTTELPNVKTNSPYHYFKNLLQLHNIIIKDCNDVLSNDFVSLVKFKLFYRQETLKPIALCASLLCHVKGSEFCIKISDSERKNIDINKLSAKWQWEILKTFTGDVVKKILENSAKICFPVNTHTIQFISLLKSINMRTE